MSTSTTSKCSQACAVCNSQASQLSWLLTESITVHTSPSIMRRLLARLCSSCWEGLVSGIPYRGTMLSSCPRFISRVRTLRDTLSETRSKAGQMPLKSSSNPTSTEDQGCDSTTATSEPKEQDSSRAEEKHQDQVDCESA